MALVGCGSAGGASGPPVTVVPTTAGSGPAGASPPGSGASSARNSLPDNTFSAKASSGAAAPTAPAPDCALPAGVVRPSVRVMTLPVFVGVLGGPVAGRPAVVLSNQSDADLCSYLPFARRLTAAGYTVALFNYAGPPVDDIVAVAGWLRAHGASRVAVAGASEGAKATVIAAATMDPAPEAVVSVSAEATLQGAAVAPSASQLTSPTLWITAKDDPYGSFDATAEFHRVDPGPVNDLLVVPGIQHGEELLPGPAGVRVLQFLRQQLGGGPAAGTAPPSSAATSSAATSSAPVPPPGCPGSTPDHPFFLAGPDGSQVEAERIGSGSTVAVFLHESGRRGMCGFADYARWLAATHRVQAVLIDFCGYGQTDCPGPDMDRTSPAELAAAAVRWARTHGARRVALVGASAGGGDALAAAATIQPRVDAVVDLSGDDGDGVHLESTAARVHAPVYYAVADGDPLCPVTQVRRLRQLTPAKTALTVVTTAPGTHGWDLLPDEHGTGWSAVARTAADWITGG